jgi:hypothetical protein
MLQKYTRTSFAAIIAVMLYMVLVYTPMWEKPIHFGKFTYDANGYYAYLPATFIYKDLKQHKYRNYIGVKYNIPSDMWGEEKNGSLVLQYSCGMAIIEAPWFALAHLTAKVGGYDTDGYSMPYQLWQEYGLLLWSVLGIYLLARLLQRYFDDKVVAFTIFGLTVGTNYLPYGTALDTYTHTSLFTIYVLLLWATIRFYESMTYKNALQIGLWVGLATLTRPTEAICIFIPLLWGVGNKALLLERIALIKAHLPKLLAAVVLTLLIGSLQLWYWKYTTGHFFFYSYNNQTFSFLKPHLYDCFLSSKKGWITYTPIILIALLGFYPLWKNKTILENEALRSARFVITLIALLSIWITFSWDIWWYGGGIGQRAMIQYFPIFAFPFAAGVQFALLRNTYKWALIVFASGALYHNTWVTYGSLTGGYMFTDTTNDAYFFSHFWRWSEPTLDEERLLDNPENNLTLVQPKTIYGNDFEQDTSSCATKTAINGSRSIRIDEKEQFSPRYKVENVPKNTKIAVTATILAPIREYAMYSNPLACLIFSYQGKQIKENRVWIHRQLITNEKIPLHWTGISPDEPFDKVEVVFWNAGSHTTTFIDDLKVEIETN